MEIVKVKIVGWEWRCEECGQTNHMSPHEYVDGQPLTCPNCFTEYESEQENW